MEKKKLNIKVKIAVGIIIFIVALFIGSFVYYKQGIKATSSKNKEVIVTIPKGSSGNDIIKILDKNKLIKSSTCAKIYLKMNQHDFKTIPEYASIISKQTGIDYNEIIQKWTDQTYLQKLIKKYWFLTDDILSDGIYYPLEGYLAPETYFLTQEDTIESITKMMLDQTQKHLEKYKTQILDFKVNSQPLTVHQFMTLSSIVQRESPVNDEDRQLVCGVLINRLNKQMPLQCDVTVNYGNQEVKIDVKHTDLNKDTKYNTYKYNGLPVGPISSISTGIIKNVLNYKESEYYYFFATQDGKVLYAKTYQEHQANANSNKWY